MCYIKHIQLQLDLNLDTPSLWSSVRTWQYVFQKADIEHSNISVLHDIKMYKVKKYLENLWKKYFENIKIPWRSIEVIMFTVGIPASPEHVSVGV